MFVFLTANSIIYCKHIKSIKLSLMNQIAFLLRLKAYNMTKRWAPYSSSPLLSRSHSHIASLSLLHYFSRPKAIRFWVWPYFSKRLSCFMSALECNLCRMLFMERTKKHIERNEHGNRSDSHFYEQWDFPFLILHLIYDAKLSLQKAHPSQNIPYHFTLHASLIQLNLIVAIF